MEELEYDALEFEVAFKRLRGSLPKRIFLKETTAQHFDSLTGVAHTN